MADHHHLFVVGVQRCGTTRLWHLLADHPEITMAEPVRPEPRGLMVDDFDHLGADGYRAKLFTGARTPWLGEKATSYLDHEIALARIGRHFAGAAVIVVLRDPVERALSHHRFTTAHGLETLSADDALGDPGTDDRPWDPAVTSVSPYEYHRRGEYLGALTRLWRHVPEDRTVILFHEELVAGPEAVSGLYERLGVGQHVPVDLGRPVNASTGPRPTLHAATVERLRHHFEPHDAALARRLGRRLPWR